MEKYIHGFWHLKGTDYQKLEQIEKYFGNFKEAWCNSKKGHFEQAGLPSEYFSALELTREVLDLEQAREKLWKVDIFPVYRDNSEFPTSLKTIDKPPFLLYRRGAVLNSLPEKKLAVVGMRKATVQGEKMAFGLSKAVSMQNGVVVSGLAFGIDAAAHSGAVAINKPTVAVLASGIGKITPSSHYSLAQRILSTGGSIISEYPVTSDAFKYRFLERNRIIAGLAESVVVVEAQERSGALITAAHALRQGKDVLAFPGDPGRVQSKGCNRLIKNGEAQLVDSIADVLKYWGNAEFGAVNQREQLNIEETSVVGLIEEGINSTEDLFKESKLEFSQLQGILSRLELDGIIARNDLQKWRVE